MGAEVVRAVDDDDEESASASAAARRVTRSDEGFEGAGDGASTGDADGEGNDDDDDALVGAADARLDRMVERWAPALPSALPLASET